jgi:hypothetical protein
MRVRELFPCRHCHRHVTSSASVCPFCHARPFVLPLMAALALGAAGCGKKQRAEMEARARAEQAKAEEEKRYVEEQRKLAEKKKELERAADIYGGPPPIDAGRSDAAAKTCNCPPGDPLCSCL